MMQPAMERAVPGWRGMAQLTLVAAWLLLTAIAFWFFKGRYIGQMAVDVPALSSHLFSTELLSLEPPSARMAGTVVHFWDPDCPCTRFSSPHVAQLIDDARQQGLHSLVILPAAAAASLGRARQRFGDDAEIRVATADSGIPASPSGVVINSQGTITYAGPYSSDAFCNTAVDAFVEVAMRDLAAGQEAPMMQRNLASACFCDWPDTATR